MPTVSVTSFPSFKVTVALPSPSETTFTTLANTCHRINDEQTLFLPNTNDTEYWLYSDFKKNDGFLNSINNSKKYKLYRQNYCGCEFSKRAAEKKSKQGL